MANSDSPWRWITPGALWVFAGQIVVGVFVVGMIYSRFLNIEAAAESANTTVQANRERVLVLEAQFVYITQKLEEISKDVKALREKP